MLGDHRTRPLVLVSAGIGATPVLAMLQALAAARSAREVWWVHGARNGREHAFRAEARQLLSQLPNGFAHVRYSRPDARDVDYDAPGRITPDVLRELPLPADAEYRICGPTEFVAALAADLDPARVSSESFGGSDPFSRPHSRGQTLPWWGSRGQGSPRAGNRGRACSRSRKRTACPRRQAAGSAPATAAARPSLRARVRHDPEPIAAAPPGSALLCCAVPDGDVLLDGWSRAASCCRMTFGNMKRTSSCMTSNVSTGLRPAIAEELHEALDELFRRRGARGDADDARALQPLLLHLRFLVVDQVHRPPRSRGRPAHLIDNENSRGHGAGAGASARRRRLLGRLGGGKAHEHLVQFFRDRGTQAVETFEVMQEDVRLSW